MSRSYLVKNNVPWDVAFSLDAGMVQALCVIFGRMDDKEFCEVTMQWKERK